MSTDPQDAITIFFRVQPNDGQCFTSSGVLLWFISFIVISCTWTLLFGSLDFRRIARHLSLPPFKSKLRNYIVCLAGSLLWNISMTVLTAWILSSDSDSSAPLRYIVMAWFARPLPGAATLLSSLFDHNAFRANFQEIIFVESLYALPPIYLLGTIASESIHFSAQASEYLAQDAHYPLGFHMLRAGAAVDLLAWILLILALGILVIVLNDEGTSQLWARKDGRIIWPFLGLCLLRCVGGGLLWGGSVLLNPGNFCPTEKMITKVTVLWAFVPLVDVLWRAVWGVDPKGDSQRDGERWSSLSYILTHITSRFHKE
jgi:hypothetical protein